MTRKNFWLGAGLLAGLVATAIGLALTQWSGISGQVGPSTAAEDGSDRQPAPPPESLRAPPAKGGERRAVAPLPQLNDSADPVAWRIFGTVSDPTGRPLGGAEVAFRTATAVSAADGTFELAVVAADARVLPTTEGILGEEGSRARAAADRHELLRVAARDCASTAQPVDLPRRGGAVRVDVRLRPGFTVTGTVLDPRGQGVGGAVVWDYFHPAAPVTTDRFGAFVLAGLDKSVPKHYLQARSRGFLTSGVTVAARATSSHRGVVIRLAQGAVVRGVVRDPSSRPVVGARLTLPSGKGRIVTVSGPDGSFEFAAVAPGPQQLSTSHPDFVPHSQRIEVPAVGQTLHVNFALAGGITISGRVVDAAGDPVPSARVAMEVPGHEGVHALSGADGGFLLGPLPAGGAVSLRASAPGYLASLTTVEATADRTGIVVALARGAQIAGRVVDAETGAPVTRFTVRFVSAAGPRKRKGGRKAFRREFVSATGEWASPAQPSGFVTDVEIEAPDYAVTRCVGVRARVGALPSDLVVELRRGATVSGSVVAPDVATLGKATVKLVTADRPLDPEAYAPGGQPVARCDPVGRFRFDHVAPGAFHLVAEHPDWGLLVARVRVVAGDPEVEVTMRVAEQARLAGFVREADGRAAAAATLVLTGVAVDGLARPQFRTRADGRGAFRFERLPPGVYRLARSTGAKTEALSRYVKIAKGGRHTVQLQVEPGATIRGTIEADGDLPRQLTVRLAPVYEDDPPLLSRQAPLSTVARDGRFVFAGLKPGRYSLRTEGWDPSTRTWWQGTASAEVVALGVADVEVSLTSGRKRP